MATMVKEEDQEGQEVEEMNLLAYNGCQNLNKCMSLPAFHLYSNCNQFD